MRSSAEIPRQGPGRRRTRLCRLCDLRRSPQVAVDRVGDAAVHGGSFVVEAASSLWSAGSERLARCDRITAWAPSDSALTPKATRARGAREPRVEQN